MIFFDDGELEIALCTYNRPTFVKEWLAHYYEGLLERNIGLTVFDSSINDETSTLIASFNKLNNGKIKYQRVDSNCSIGLKPTIPMMSIDSKYVWVCGDSRVHPFLDLDTKVFPLIKRSIDFITFFIVDNESNDGKIYYNKSEFLNDCLISLTCIGLSIYKTALFDRLRFDATFRSNCNNKYEDNYGFAWIGYFLESFALGNYSAAFVKIDITDLLPRKKKQQWSTKFYECWAVDLCDLLDALPECYQNRQFIPQNTWKSLKFDTRMKCYFARKYGDLTSKKYDLYASKGYLTRITKKTKRLRFFAKAPLFLLFIITIPDRIVLYLKIIKRKIVKLLCF